MSQVKLVRLMIVPQTKVNVSENEKWMYAEGVTDKYLLEFGAKKRQKQIDEGKDPKKAIKANAYYTRKQYVLKYYEYKKRVKELFFQSGLKEFPVSQVHFSFFLPMPKSWNRKKKNQHRYEPHQNMCDASNLHKSLEDACSDKDRKNWDYRASKFWHDIGFIEIEIGGLLPATGYRKFEIEEKIK